jgi:hypothetical protein
VSTHTPGPWEKTQSHDIFQVGGNCLVASCSGNSGFYPNAEANAAFIVRACNSHDDLLEVLEAIIISQSAILDNLKVKAIAAIAKAKGDPS